MTITFPARLTIEESEKFLGTVAESTVVQDLTMPLGGEALVFGGIAAAVQAAMTWARLSESRQLNIRGKVEELERLVDGNLSRPHKFCAAMMARTILDTDSKISLAPILYVEAERQIEQQGQSPYGQQRGGLCWFAFVDHSTKGFDRNFYIENNGAQPEVRQLNQIRSVIRAMVEKSISVVGAKYKLSEVDLDHIGRLFYELFLNTHEHGSRGKVKYDWLKPGVRVLYTNAVNIPALGGDASRKAAPPIDFFLKDIEFRQDDRRRFIEISIVDSGLGFLGRWISDGGESLSTTKKSLADEYEIFKRCFTFRQTSSKSLTKGNGLPVVMDRLTQLKGFMKIRAGRLSLYRNFVSNPYIDGESCKFSDWLGKDLNIQPPSEMPPVAGVLVTILLPLGAV